MDCFGVFVLVGMIVGFAAEMLDDDEELVLFCNESVDDLAWAMGEFDVMY